MRVLSFFILYSFFYGSSSVLANFSPEVRHFSPHSTIDGLKFGYVNLERFANSFLDVPAILNMVVEKLRDCFTACVRTDGCLSINAEHIPGNNIYNCSLLSSDKYRSFQEFKSSNSTYTHFAIVSACSYQKPCPNTVDYICIPHYNNRSFECKCKIGPTDPSKSCVHYYSSCKEIVAKYPSSLSGFYDIFMDKLRTVYCDMVTDGGGWIMIGNVSSIHKDPNSVSPDKSAINSLDVLEDFTSGNFVLSGEQFLTLHKYMDIRQFRIYCKKTAVGRVVDVASNPDTSEGRLYFDYILGISSEWLTTTGVCISTFKILPGDTSDIKDSCIKVPFDVKERLYDHGYYDSHNRHVQLRRGRLECDDRDNSYVEGPNTYGVWRFFAR